MLRKTDAGLWATEIEGITYEFEKWGAEDATDTLLDLTKITGKSLAVAIGSILSKDGEEKKSINPDIIGQIVDCLMQGLSDKATCKALIRKFSSEKCFCNGAKINFDQHYRDRLFHMILVIKAALEVQFGNFFGALLGSAGITVPKTMPIMNRAP